MRTPSLALLTLPLAAITLHAQDSSSTPSSRIADSTITVPAGARVFAEVERQVRMRFAKPGDSVYLTTSVPVVIGSQTAIPAGTSIMAVFDTIARRGGGHDHYQLSLRVTSLVFPNGRVITASVPARATASRTTGLRDEDRGAGDALLYGGGGTAAGMAVGAMIDNRQGAVLAGGLTGLAVGGLLSSLMHRRTVVLDVGLPLELVLRESVVLDARVALERLGGGTEPGSALGGRPALLRHRLCYRPGDPGTPDIIIPGSPGTPPVGDQPGTPPTPPTVIPGTPEIPATWYRCR